MSLATACWAPGSVSWMTLRTHTGLGRSESRRVKVRPIYLQGIDREEPRIEHLHRAASPPSAFLAPAPLTAADRDAAAAHRRGPARGKPVRSYTRSPHPIHLVAGGRALASPRVAR